MMKFAGGYDFLDMAKMGRKNSSPFLDPEKAICFVLKFAKRTQKIVQWSRCFILSNCIIGFMFALACIHEKVVINYFGREVKCEKLIDFRQIIYCLLGLFAVWGAQWIKFGN